MNVNEVTQLSEFELVMRATRGVRPLVIFFDRRLLGPDTCASEQCPRELQPKQFLNVYSACARVLNKKGFFVYVNKARCSRSLANLFEPGAKSSFATTSNVALFVVQDTRIAALPLEKPHRRRTFVGLTKTELLDARVACGWLSATLNQSVKTGPTR